MRQESWHTSAFSLESRLSRPRPFRILSAPQWGRPVRAAFALALAFVFAGAVFYANAHYVARRWNELMDTEFERRCFRAFSYVAGLMALVAAWLAFPGVWTAVAWAALALLAAFSGRRLTLTDVALQAHLFSALVLARVLVANLDATQVQWGLTLRALTLSMVAFALYLGARWSGAEATGQGRRISEAYTSCASALIAILSITSCRARGSLLAG
jgi:hypothetical protein